MHTVSAAAAGYESMGQSIALNKNNANAITIDDGVECVSLDDGLRTTESMTNVSTKASTGALLADEGDENLSLPSEHVHQPHTVINMKEHDMGNGSAVVHITNA